MAGQEGQPLESGRSASRFVPWLSVAGYLSLAVVMGLEAESYSSGFSCGGLGLAPSCSDRVRSLMEFVILWIAAAATVGILIWGAAFPARAERFRIPRQAIVVEGCLVLLLLVFVIGPVPDLIRDPVLSRTLYHLFQLGSLLILALAFLDPQFESGRYAELTTTVALFNGVLGLFFTGTYVAILLTPGP